MYTVALGYHGDAHGGEGGVWWSCRQGADVRGVRREWNITGGNTTSSNDHGEEHMNQASTSYIARKRFSICRTTPQEARDASAAPAPPALFESKFNALPASINPH